ncbi:MAG UNVERIFIED_CONTAM: glycoside hydrolase [Planctomycetaceae bacterium]
MPKLLPPYPHEQFFEGPKPFVRVPDGAVGPVFISQNHSPSITECPNGDLLAVWFSTLGETDLTTANAASRLRFARRNGSPHHHSGMPQDVNDHAPKIWWDGHTTIFHFVEARGHGDNLVRRSTDNGGTWSKAEVIRPHGEPANHPIRLKDGVIAMPYDNSSLLISRDDGRTWRSRGRDLRSSDDLRPGKSGPLIAGYHAPIVQLADGRLMAFSRLDAVPLQEQFGFKMPANYSSDLGETWEWGISEFPIVSSVQKPVMLRLKEGPLVLCSFTDQWREWKNRKGLVFQSTGGEYIGYGLFAAVSYDEGKTWPDRRLLVPEGKSVADGYGYLAATQTQDGRIQLITSKDHYIFNLAWIKQRPSARRSESRKSHETHTHPPHRPAARRRWPRSTPLSLPVLMSSS